MTLATELAHLRADRGLEGKVVAEAVGVSASVISKWERGERIPSDENLSRVADCFRLNSKQAKDLIRLAESARDMRPRKRRSRNEFKRCQENLLAAEAEAKYIRQYENILVPAALQTPQFTRVVLESAGLPEDEVDELRELRMKRADLLYDASRSYHFLIDQAVLERLWAAGTHQDHLLGDRDLVRRRLDRPDREPVILENSVSHAQVRHLVNLASDEHKNVQIRILPRQQTGRLTLFGGFRIYDERAVSLETRAELLWTTDLAKVSEYVDDFELAWDHTAPDPSAWKSELFPGQSTSELLHKYFDEIAGHLSGEAPQHSSPANR